MSILPGRPRRTSPPMRPPLAETRVCESSFGRLGSLDVLQGRQPGSCSHPSECNGNPLPTSRSTTATDHRATSVRILQGRLASRHGLGCHRIATEAKSPSLDRTAGADQGPPKNRPQAQWPWPSSRSTYPGGNEQGQRPPSSTIRSLSADEKPWPKISRTSRRLARPPPTG